MAYQLTKSGVLRKLDGAHIPNDPLNRDYAQYQAWLDAGNSPEAADPPPVPQSVTMRQARQQLFIDGLLASVDTVIASMPSPHKELAQIEWDKSQIVERDRPLVINLGLALGLDSAEMDQLFINAAKL